MRLLACARRSSNMSSSLRSFFRSLMVFICRPPQAVPALARRTGARLGRGPAGERRLDERLDIAVQDPLHVSDLDACPVVLHEGVGMQDVAADLAAPVGGAQLAALLGLLRLLLENAL